ncbi:Uncharacterised protein [Escherichia coli]|uniref:Uncharacterized protein n=1 Tax=Escherichia coli TaxID=562 RepID=A0A376KHZ0_ECOLX|nr:Uncharacterised protein [Escherichia coli]
MKMKNLSPVLMLLISLQTVAAVRESAPEGTRTQASSQVSTTTQAAAATGRSVGRPLRRITVDTGL